MIKVLLFAGLREAAGQAEVVIQKNEMSVKDLRRYLKEEHHLTDVDGAMIAVNEAYANETDLITDGDVAALIPPVSGG